MDVLRDLQIRRKCRGNAHPVARAPKEQMLLLWEIADRKEEYRGGCCQQTWRLVLRGCSCLRRLLCSDQSDALLEAPQPTGSCQP